MDLDAIDGARVTVAVSVYARQEHDIERTLPLVRVPAGTPGTVRHAFYTPEDRVPVVVVKFDGSGCIARVNYALVSPCAC